MTLSVRPAEAGDLETVARLLEGLHERPDVPADPAIWSRMLAQEGREILVADLNGAVVGTADLLIVANLTHGARPWASVENVIVDPGHRGRGIGWILMDAIRERAEGNGCYKVQLSSRKDREAARRLYLACGFEPSAEGFRLYL